MTQIELATAGGVSLAFIRNVEQGHIPKQSPTLERLLSALNDARPAVEPGAVKESGGRARHDEP